MQPIKLGLALLLLTLGWGNSRWETWVMRALAAAISLLTLPAIQIILQESPSQWLFRLILISLVWISALASGFLSGRWRQRPPAWRWAVLILLGLIGFLLPTWQYLAVRPLVSQVLGLAVGIGLGVWLNAAGHLLAVVVGLYEWRVASGEWRVESG